MDNSNHRIQKISSNGRFVASVGTRDSNPLQFRFPLGIGFNKKNGKLYVCDTENHRIQILGTDLIHHSVALAVEEVEMESSIILTILLLIEVVMCM